jgi:hypothetical protein
MGRVHKEANIKKPKSYIDVPADGKWKYSK